MPNNIFKEVLRKHSHKFFWLIPILGIIAIGLLSSTAFVQKKKATLSTYPSNGTFLKDEVFEVKIRIDATEDINAVAADVTYSPDKLEVIKISREKSILKLWVQEATLNEKLGFIRFAGGLPNPGFRGTGEVLTVAFRAKDTGWASVGFSSAEILANDGRGTNVLEDISASVFSIQDAYPKFPDFNNSGRIDMADVRILVAQLGKPGNKRYDIDGDGQVNFRDVSLLISLLGRSKF